MMGLPLHSDAVVGKEVSFQFSTRTIIWVMGACAIAAAIVGPFARRLDRNQVTGIVAYLLSVMLIAAFIVVRGGWKRRRMEKQAGGVRFVFLHSRWSALPVLFLT